MKERPILFSAPMVRALLDGSKTQTRRAVKFGKAYEKKPPTIQEAVDRYGAPGHFTLEAGFFGAKCRFGVPGDRLWVRETWGLCRPFDSTDWERRTLAGFSVCPHGWQPEYRASWHVDDGSCFWRPSIHMHRWASRITLEVTGVRVERLQDISDADAKAEGVGTYEGVGADQRVPGPGFGGVRLADQPHRLPFADLWRSINGDGSWDANPWVWVVEFQRVTP